MKIFSVVHTRVKLPAGKREFGQWSVLKDYTNLVPDSTVSGKIYIAPALEADILFLFFRVLWFKAVVFKALYTVRKSKS